VQKARLEDRIREVMNSPLSTREAKEYLVAQITAEEQREGISLSDVERKMLYFSETGWTLPEIMEVNEQFDQDYDQDEYEEKIAKLVRSATKRVKKENPEEYDRWLDAVRQLSTEDHYILLIVARGGISMSASAEMRPPHDRLKLWGTGFAIVAFFLCVVFLALKFNIDPGFAVWATLAGVAVACVLLGLLFGTERTNALLVRILENLFGNSGKNK
jgi:multidrug transporter EmrE-like cation transporter